MAEPQQEWKFGHIDSPDDAWLATAVDKPVLDADLPIVDPHPHLWQRGDHRYFLDQLLADLNTGHTLLATAFLECRSLSRKGGPAEPSPVGDAEFVAGLGARRAPGNYGPTRVEAGALGYA